MNEIEPVRVPKDVLEGLEAVRRYARTDVLDIATVRGDGVPSWCGSTSTRKNTAGVSSRASEPTRAPTR